MDRTEFWGQIGRYNQDFAGLHAVWIVASLLLLAWIALRPGRWPTLALKAFLALTFLANGSLFFIGYGAGNNARTYVFSALFLVVGVLFFVDIFRNRIRLELPQPLSIRIATVLGLLSVYTYPFVGMLLGRRFPEICLPMDPCPSTVFAIVVVACAYPHVNRVVLAALLPWGLLGLPKTLGAYGCYEDALLFAAGLYGLVVLVVPIARQRGGTKTPVRTSIGS